MIRPILAYGNPLLKQKSFKVDINNEDVSDLIFDMWETMYNANGVGLAAPQIGILKQIFIADFEHFKEEDSFDISEIHKYQKKVDGWDIIKGKDEIFFLSKKIFKIDSSKVCPSVIKKDNVDYLPTSSMVLFGHHFTSIAGTGPIVGPAIAIIWGWVPALIWILVGSIFMGAVHDFGSFMISLRYDG